jgi:hypothetical protein
VQLNDSDALPSAVGSVEGGDGMAAMVFFSDDLKLCDLHYLAFSHHSSSYSAFFHLAYYRIHFFCSTWPLKLAYFKNSFLIVVCHFSLLHCCCFFLTVPLNINCVPHPPQS